MINRLLGIHVLQSAAKMPVVSVIGPRQSGKSTLVQHLFPDHKYRNLEDIELRNFALSDSKGFLENAGTKAIIDEIQYAPELMSYIQAPH